jgi:acetylornithine deacetylase/succinyl-diaminopimelate desuccinylase-like protein
MDKYLTNILKTEKLPSRTDVAHQGRVFTSRLGFAAQAELPELLEKLVSFRTVSANIAQNRKAIAYIDKYLRRYGMKTKYAEFNGRPSLYAHTRSVANSKPAVLLAGHIDVVPAHDKDFRMRTTAEKYYGRGVMDMKFAIAAYLKLVHALRKDISDFDFGILITSDEELGGQNGVAQYVKHGLKPKVCVIPDGGFDWQLQIGSNGIATFKVMAEGKAGHASLPWNGDNAILKLDKALMDIARHFKNTENSHSTMNIGLIQGGTTSNQIPDYAEAEIDTRFEADEDKERIFSFMKEVEADNDVYIRQMTDGSATKFDLDDPMIAPFAKLVEKETGVTVTGMWTRGSNDARFFAKLHVPCISLYIPGGNHHAEGEFIHKKGLVQFYNVLRAYVEQTAASQE